MDRYVKNSLGKYDKLYEQNIGIIEVSERLFKIAIEIAIDNSKLLVGLLDE